LSHTATHCHTLQHTATTEAFDIDKQETPRAAINPHPPPHKSGKILASPKSRKFPPAKRGVGGTKEDEIGGEEMKTKESEKKGNVETTRENEGQHHEGGETGNENEAAMRSNINADVQKHADTHTDTHADQQVAPSSVQDWAGQVSHYICIHFHIYVPL